MATEKVIPLIHYISLINLFRCVSACVFVFPGELDISPELWVHSRRYDYAG